MLHEISSSMVKYILLLAVTIKTDNNLKLSGSNLSNKKKNVLKNIIIIGHGLNFVFPASYASTN